MNKLIRGLNLCGADISFKQILSYDPMSIDT